MRSLEGEINKMMNDPEADSALLAALKAVFSYSFHYTLYIVM